MDKKNQTLKPDDKNQSLGPTRARHNSSSKTEQETDKKIMWKIVRTNQPGEHSAAGETTETPSARWKARTNPRKFSDSNGHCCLHTCTHMHSLTTHHLHTNTYTQTHITHMHTYLFLTHKETQTTLTSHTDTREIN